MGQVAEGCVASPVAKAGDDEGEECEASRTQGRGHTGRWERVSDELLAGSCLCLRAGVPHRLLVHILSGLSSESASRHANRRLPMPGKQGTGRYGFLFQERVAIDQNGLNS